MNFVASLEKSSFPSGDGHGAHGWTVLRRERREEKEFSRQRNDHPDRKKAGHGYNIICKWEPFREQILSQWKRLSAREVDEVGPNRSRLAMLIENKYGIAAHLVENYLRNFERTLPLI